jgi:predicted deacylase
MPKKQKIEYSFIKILTGSDLSSRKLALMSVAGRQSGPVVWLTACVHGDEVGGIFVIQEIFKRLQKNPLKKGAVYAFPLMNPVSFETGSHNIILRNEISPYKEDLNRSFPGDPNGSLAERIAAKIFQRIIFTKPTLVLDLHNDWIQSIPYTLIDPYPGLKYRQAYEQTKEFGYQTGLLLINEQETEDDADELKRSLSGSLLRQNIPALTLELGGSYIFDEKNIRLGVNAIWNILSALEMVEEPTATFFYPELKKFQGKILKYSHSPISPESGIVRFLTTPGTIIKKGQATARIYNIFGRHEQTILSPYDGVVLGNSDSVVALPGVPIMAIGVL